MECGIPELLKKSCHEHDLGCKGMKGMESDETGGCSRCLQNPQYHLCWRSVRFTITSFLMACGCQLPLLQTLPNVSVPTILHVLLVMEPGND